MKKTVLREYAKLIVRVGANVQKGQDVVVNAGLDQPEFVKMVVEEAYKAGAANVMVQWSYQPLTKLDVRYKTLKNLSAVQEWEKAKWQHFVDKMPAMIHLSSADPDGLKGMNVAKFSKANQASRKVIKPYRDQMDNKYQWCIAAVPGEAWAKKVFPGCSKRQAVEKMWEAILNCARANGDAVAAWDEHNKDLISRCQHLTDMGIKSLHITADNGTDFTVELIEESHWCGGGDTTIDGIYFNPNMPTEECFISPMKGKAEGIVYSTKPLSYQGQLLENFSVRFENGKAVEVHAEKGEEALKAMISMDEGASYLGEVALVPERSPIAESGLLFYNTLFDENAACHLAIGAGFTNTINNFEEKTMEECHAMGVNESMTHVDFMIGCASMNIDATCRDGQVRPVFRNGNWAF